MEGPKEDIFIRAEIGKAMRSKFSFLTTLASLTLIWSLSASTSNFSQEAKEYRKKGYEAQKAGDIEMAAVYYRKAIALDPFYAIPHNDLGIIYEMKGLLGKAEEEYKSAIRIDPNFAEAHMNLALLYERMNRIEEAIPHFIKRIELGEPDDPWTKRAWEKLWKYAPDQAKEVEAKILAQEVARKLKEEREAKKVQAEKHYQKGLFYFEKGLYENAYKELKQALSLLPEEPKYQEMYRKADLKYRLEQINLHFKNGVGYFEANDFVKAKQEFEKIIELIPREE